TSEDRVEIGDELFKGLVPAGWQAFPNLAFVREIEHSFDLRTQRQYSLLPTGDAPAEMPIRQQQRRAALGLGLGHDQIRKALDAGEVNLAVLKCTPGEFPGPGTAQSIHARKRLLQRRHDRAAAVQVELGHVLTGLAVRRREV